DLRLFVEDVSDSANVPVEDAGEPVHTVEELSKMFNVSTKTISRWREQGLVSRRFLFDGKRKRVGFLHSSVDRFVQHNTERVRRFCRTRTTIYRVLNEMRARRILELPLDYMYHESFDKAAAEKDILGPTPAAPTPTKKVRGPSGLPPYLAALYEVPLLTREQE